jgi:nucleotide-binding universal stress UspA family protein
VYRKIIVGYQDTEQGRDALALGKALAQACEAEMLVATVPTEGGRDLAELARTERADLLVLGSTHRGPVGRVLPGAMADRLLGDATCAVAVAPRGFGGPSDGDSGWRPLGGDDERVGIRVIGCGYDGSPAAREALDIAAELAVSSGAALRVYAVALNRADVPTGALGGRQASTSTEPEKLRDALHQAVASLPAEARALPVVLRGLPAVELLYATECGVDLLVLGSERGGPVRRAFLGSVSSTVLERASCPTLISPSGVRARWPALA